MPPDGSRSSSADGAARVLSAALAADALDRLGAPEQVLHAQVRPIQPGLHLVGRARPVKVRRTHTIPEELYAGEMAAIAALTPGDVLVYEVDPEVDAAIFGELFSLAARNQGALGAVLDGPVRDVRQMRDLGFPVFANGYSPKDTRGRAEVVAFDQPVTCAGVTVRRNDLVVADDDGAVVVPAALVERVLEEVAVKVGGERGARVDLLEGASVHAVWEKWQVF